MPKFKKSIMVEKIVFDSSYIYENYKYQYLKYVVHKYLEMVCIFVKKKTITI